MTLRSWLWRLRRLAARAIEWVLLRIQERWPKIILTLAGVALIGWTLVRRDADTQMSFTTIVLRDIPELRAQEGPDVGLAEEMSSKIVAIEIDGEPAAGLSPGESLAISTPGAVAACPTLVLTPGVRNGNATVSISPRGERACAISIQSDRTLKAPTEAPTLRNGQQITFVLAAGAATGTSGLVVFENAAPLELAGWLQKPLAAIEGLGLCPGRHLDKMVGERLLIRSARMTVGEQPHFDLDLHADGLAALVVDDADCRSVVFKRAAHKWIGDTILKWLLSVAAIVGAWFVPVRTRPAPPPDPPLIVPAAMLLLALLNPAPARAAAAPARHAVLVAAWIDCKDRKPHDELKGRVTEDTEAIALALTAAGDLRIEGTLWNPPASELLAAVKQTSGPLWFVYTGHGSMQEGKSVLCLPDRNLPVEELIENLPEGAAAVWLNGCKTAAVDVKRPATSVFSASPDEVGAEGAGTFIGPAIAQAVAEPDSLSAPLDTDCDGLVTDAELFAAVKSVIPRVGQLPPRPKLRQAWSPVPLFSAPAGRARCTGAPVDVGALARRYPRLRKLFREDARYRAGRHVTDGLPPVVWLTDRPRTRALGVAPYVVRNVAPADADRLARGLLSARLWRLSFDRGRMVVASVDRPDVPVLADESFPADTAPSARDLEARRFLTRFVLEPSESGDSRRRYERPVTADERRNLERSGFRACGCESPTGHCFCGPPQAKGQTP